MERDGANLFALEGVLIALIILGAAYAIRPTSESSLDNVRPRAELGKLANDILTVLKGLDDGNGTSMLDHYLVESIHCASDVSPSATECDGRRAKNLSLKVENYLPLGAGYAVAVGSGAATREIYRSPQPRGESVSASFGFAPEWNTTFVATELSCYDVGTAVNITMVPIDRGAVRYTRWGNATLAGVETAGVRSVWPQGWNVTIPAAGRPASGTIAANVTGNATLRGTTAYGSCVIGTAFDAVTAAIRATTFTVSSTAVPLGGSATFNADLAAIAAVSGLIIDGVEVSVFEPLPPRADSPDTWIEASRIALAGGATRTGIWTPAGSTLYGTHPALLRVGITVGGTHVELHRVLTVDIALPTGQVPIDPPYRAVLQAWLPDWG